MNEAYKSVLVPPDIAPFIQDLYKQLEGVKKRLRQLEEPINPVSKRRRVDTDEVADVVPDEVAVPQDAGRSM